MKVEETRLKGCYIITPRIFEDFRGEFFESFNKQKFQELTGVETTFVQDNQSVSKKGVLRGLHFQAGNYTQAKLVRVVQGEVLDVCVDLRESSETFGKYFSVVLDTKAQQQLYIPKGFAHGFLTLSERAIFHYKCDNYYHKESECGIIYNDKTLNIDWGISENNVIISEKDEKLPTFQYRFK